ncbi:MAG: carboxypeptidase regulatory-like domain-containing protein [Deltaproteobacteria bacterium]|nr:carboxypeptidase regulatory-like domain-containing protein [Deltaproteobacteria bacterium]
MTYKNVVIFFLFTFFMLPPILYAHGVMGRVDTGGMVVSAQYDTGEPMSYAKVKIAAPGTKLTFQSGRTDRNGRFCFFPDAPGNWKVVVDDEIGHRLEVLVPVNDLKELIAEQQVRDSSGSSVSRYEKALMGICFIFGISGIFFWWKGKRFRGKISQKLPGPSQIDK